MVLCTALPLEMKHSFSQVLVVLLAESWLLNSSSIALTENSHLIQNNFFLGNPSSDGHPHSEPSFKIASQTNFVLFPFSPSTKLIPGVLTIIQSCDNL
jgi:hypothetical protein